MSKVEIDNIEISPKKAIKINKKSEKKSKKSENKSIKHNKKNTAKKKHQIEEQWYRLDNSALIYPSISSSEWNSVFRISASMDEDVDVEILQNALELTVKRFPFFNVCLREGMFWYYFGALVDVPKVEKETQYPCRPFSLKNKSNIFRVLYFKNKITFESFHSLTDGYGGIIFLNVLVTTYIDLKYGIQDKSALPFNVYDKPNIEEQEDAFRKYANPKDKSSRKEQKAFAIKEPVLPIEILKIFTATTNLAELKAVSKEYNATLNEFLSAVYLMSLIEMKHLSKKRSNLPVRLSIPINIRKRRKSKTMRNFSMVLNIQINVEDENKPLEDIIKIVQEQNKLLDDDFINAFIGSNIASENNFFVRIIPLFLKNIVLKMVYKKVGESRFTSTISNVGMVAFPDEVQKHITKYQVTIGATKLNPTNLSVISMGEQVNISMSSRLKDNTLPKIFFTKLASYGLSLELTTNISEDL